jgi:hypothetical protein
VEIVEKSWNQLEEFILQCYPMVKGCEIEREMEKEQGSVEVFTHTL